MLIPRRQAQHRHRATGAWLPCLSGTFHWPCATPIACLYPVDRHAHAHVSALRAPHAPLSSLAPPPPPRPCALSSFLSLALPFGARSSHPHTTHADPPHTTHAPKHASCATCRSRAPASLVASMSSAAAASCPLPHARHRAVLPFCTCVCTFVTCMCVWCRRTAKCEKKRVRGVKRRK